MILHPRVFIALVFGFLTWNAGVSLAEAAERPRKYTELLPYLVAAPDQGHSDNCLYMAATGAVEILANKYHGVRNPRINGRFDFNERYAYSGDLDEFVSWFENPVLKFNTGAVRNAEVPYSNGTFWNDYFPEADKIKLPKLKTKWFLQADDGDREGRFNVDEFTDKDVEKIKDMLVTYRSPVVIIYRDAGYESDYGYWNSWHAVVLAGYDDDYALEEKCPIATRTIEHAGGWTSSQIEKALKRQGGCRDRGAFFARDSEDAEEGEERAPRMVIRTYDDIKLLGNNAMVVYMPELVKREQGN